MLSVRTTSQQSPFNGALTRFLDDTVRRERNRKRLARLRLLAFVAFSVLACGWPDIHPDAANAAAPQLASATGRVASFACPGLGPLIAQSGVVELNWQRLAFASGASRELIRLTEVSAAY